MDQISRPMQVALIAVVLFAAAWMTVLRPSAEGEAGGSAEVAAAPVAAASVPSTPAAPAAATPAPAPEPITAATPKEPAKAAEPKARVATPRTTILLFAGKGADDKVARDVVDGVRGKNRRVIVGTSADVGRHQDLLGGIEVLAMPTIVVVGPSGEARRIEGLPDAALLEQAIADAR